MYLSLYPFLHILQFATHKPSGLRTSPRNVCDALDARRVSGLQDVACVSARARVLPRAGLHTSRLPRDELVGRRSRQRWRAAKAKGSSQLRVECVRTCVRACDATGSVALRALFHLPPCFELGMPRPLASLPFPFSLLVVPEPVQLPRQNKQPSCRPRQPTASSTLAPRGALYYIVACSRGMPYDARRGFISPQKSNIISHLSKPSPAAAFVVRAGGCRVSGIVCSERSRTVLSLQAPARARTHCHAGCWCRHGPL